LDKKNKGGRSLVIRCACVVNPEGVSKNDTDCPFYAKLRRSNKDGRWYICAGLETNHTCGSEIRPERYADVDSMLAVRNSDDAAFDEIVADEQIKM
jgi:hypothetical protein